MAINVAFLLFISEHTLITVGRKIQSSTMSCAMSHPSGLLIFRGDVIGVQHDSTTYGVKHWLWGDELLVVVLS
jgi:hypothetical protein